MSIEQRQGDKDDFRNVDTVSKLLEEASQGKVTAVDATSNGEGIKVQARNSHPRLSAGTRILSSSAIAIALNPDRWLTHCSTCAIPISTLTATPCKACHMVTFCLDCQGLSTSCGGGTKIIQNQHFHECQILQRFGSLLEQGVSPSMDITSHLLTIRLLCIAVYQSDKGKHDKGETLDSKSQPIVPTWLHAIMTDLYAATQLSTEDVTNLQTVFESCWPQNSAFKPKLITDDYYRRLYERVLGCSHAITDPSLPLGTQCLGRSLFWEHSFYNHGCRPNAFLSCQYGTFQNQSNSHTKEKTHAVLSSGGQKTVVANVHLLRNVQPWEDITLSYIPMSGLSRKERRERLLQHYGFHCDCNCCSLQDQIGTNSGVAQQLKNVIELPDGVDVESIRQIQFSCSEKLLALCDQEQLTASQGNITISDDSDNCVDDEIEHVLSLVRMTQRGIENQGIPPSHEVALEAHRLLAMGYSKVNRSNEALLHHRAWFENSICTLMDPVAIATQKLDLARDLVASTSKRHTAEDKNQEITSENTAQMEWDSGLENLTLVLGADHPWVRTLRGNRLFSEGNQAKKAKTDKAF